MIFDNFGGNIHSSTSRENSSRVSSFYGCTYPFFTRFDFGNLTNPPTPWIQSDPIPNQYVSFTWIIQFGTVGVWFECLPLLHSAGGLIFTFEEHFINISRSSLMRNYPSFDWVLNSISQTKINTSILYQNETVANFSI